ncbi:MAG: phosphatase PAP2 family protein [Thermoguttaceae bacterium]|nr:phosphatase PAP2 family protein [Thermoguttaceae bacterium]MDW8039299.1 phosphatase PAP2 family protein [Thermoguttaceae bacterium]
MEAAAGVHGGDIENRDIKLGRTWSAKTALRAGLCFLLLAVAALGVDGPLARWIHSQKTGASYPPPPPNPDGSSAQAPQSSRYQIPGVLKRLLNWAEGFGHGVGVLLLALVIYQLDPSHRRPLVRALCMALASGLVADGMKLLVARTRPRAFILTEPIWESFVGILPGLTGGTNGQSFPSAHVATAAGWSLGLGWLYPRGRWIFMVLAFLVLCQRLEANAHFLSDTLAGGAVGCLVSSLFLPGGWLNRWFVRWETSACAASQLNHFSPRHSEENLAVR